MHVAALHDDGLAGHVATHHVVLGDSRAVTAHTEPLIRLVGRGIRHFLVLILPLIGNFAVTNECLKELLCADHFLVRAVPRTFNESHRIRIPRTKFCFTVWVYHIHDNGAVGSKNGFGVNAAVVAIVTAGKRTRDAFHIHTYMGARERAGNGDHRAVLQVHVADQATDIYVVLHRDGTLHVQPAAIPDASAAVAASGVVLNGAADDGHLRIAQGIGQSAGTRRTHVAREGAARQSGGA